MTAKASPAASIAPRATVQPSRRSPQTNATGRLIQALELLELGLRPFPVREKMPCVKWKRLQSVAPTVDEVTEWFTKFHDAEIAIVCGHDGGLDAIDLDLIDGHLPDWPSADCELPTGCVDTTTRGGRHYYFQHVHSVRNSESVLAPHVDVRGTGGMVVVTGKGREILNGSFADALRTPAPDWLRDALLAIERKKSTRTDFADIAPDEVLAGIPEGKRDKTLFLYALDMFRRGFTQLEAETMISQAARVCTPPFPTATAVEKVRRRYHRADHGGQTTGTLGDARDTVDQWLELPDLDVVDVILATVLANAHAGDPVWVLVVGPPSSAKSELLRALEGAPHVYRLGSLTGKTLVSGHKDVGGGLLFKIPDLSTMVLLDFGVVLSLHPNDKALVLQRLREVYDGFTRGDFGNRTDGVEWSGKLGFLAGVTPAVERFTSVGAELGDRFILYPLEVPDPGGQADDALAVSGFETTMRDDLRHVFGDALVNAGNPETVTLPAESKTTLRDLAVLTVTLRTPVARDRFDKSIEYIPQAEGPARLVKALLVLGKALAALRGHDHVGDLELRTLARMSLRCIPSKRRAVLQALLTTGTEGTSTKALGLTAELPTTTTQYILEDLHLLGAVDRWVTSNADNAPFHWRLKAAIAEKLILANYLTGHTSNAHTQKLERDIREKTDRREESIARSQVFACEPSTDDPEVTL